MPKYVFGRKAKQWSKEEEQKLVSIYTTVEYHDEIFQHFPERTKSAVMDRIKVLKIAKTRSAPFKKRKKERTYDKNCNVCSIPIGVGTQRKGMCKNCYYKDLRKKPHIAKNIKEHRKEYYSRPEIRKRENERNRILSRTPETRFKKASSMANFKKKEWTLTLDQYKNLVFDSTCDYCSGPLPEVGIGLDRIDTSRGYNIDNVVPCCRDCNYIKGDVLTYEEAHVAIKAVMEFRKNQEDS